MGNLFNIAVLWAWDPERNTFLTGGLERWCRDLAQLVALQGYKVRIFQKANHHFRALFQSSIEIVGLPSKLSFHGHIAFKKQLEVQCSPEDPIVFVSQELAMRTCLRRSVTVNHGIWWDGDYPYWKKWVNRNVQYHLINRVSATVCVDTNYINWCHAELPHRDRWQGRLHYVPNYADTGQFPEQESGHLLCDTPILLFPRRLEGRSLEADGRGAGFLLSAVELLFKRGIKVQVVFAGRGKLRPEVVRWAEVHGMSSQIHCREFALDEMPAAYRDCQVVVVPSLAHEGTSLAAVEGLVSGKPVIVSHIGGLANLVIDGLNGYVCDLNIEALADAIQTALDPPAKPPAVLEAMRASFSKERWERRIWSILSSHLELPNASNFVASPHRSTRG